MEDQRAEEIWWENEIRSGRDPSKYCGCSMNIPVPKYSPITYPAYGALCGCQKQAYREDCYFYHEERQMGGTIPTCSYYSKGLGFCPCDGCKKGISSADVYKLAKDAVDKDG